MSRAGALASGESRRTSGELGISGNIIMPCDMGRAQDAQCLHWLEAGSQRCIGRQWWHGGTAQIAVIARVCRRERVVGWCLFGRRGGFAVTDGRERIDGRRCGELWNGSPQHSLQSDGNGRR